MSLPDISLEGQVVTQAIAYGVVAVIAWFAQRNLSRLETDVSMKADKDDMAREMEDLRAGLREARDARERDIERLERAHAEKFNELSASMRDRFSAMENNVSIRLGEMREDMGQKLDMILKLVEK